MVSKTKYLLLIISVLLTVGGVISATASAEIYWKVEKHWLTGKLYVLTHGNVNINVAAGQLVKCAIKDEGEIVRTPSGRLIRASELTSITFESCQQLTPRICPATATANGLPWPAYLFMRGGDKIAVLIKKIKYTVTIKCSGESAQETVDSGNLESEWNNTESSSEFPSTPLPESTLENGEGKEIVLSGDDVSEGRESKEKIEAEYDPPPWFIEGTEMESGTKYEVKLKGEKPYVIKSKIGSSSLEVECKKQTSNSGEVLGGRPGKGTAAFELSECSAKAPTKCSVAKPITLSSKLELVENASAEEIYALLTPKEGENIATIELTGCEKAEYNKSYKMTGSAAAETSSSGSTVFIKFPGTAIKTVLNEHGEEQTIGLKIGGEPAELSGETSAEVVETNSSAVWLINGASLSTSLPTQISAELLLEDTGVPIIGKAAVECGEIFSGSVGTGGEGETTEVLNLSLEKVSGTPLTGLALLCKKVTACEGATVEVWPAKLPWKSSVVVMSPSGSFLYWISKAAFYVSCTVLGIKSEDECTVAENTSSRIFNEVGGGAFIEGIATPDATCTLSKAATGVIQTVGKESISSTEGTVTVSP
ncbi:MAG TPA: hypothetical protein VK701_08890 [Solirubrobacteraceae bacterium]|jgi:hypothetical protein|nr:hypothetical protein [Solirubrobacteraceae bacterium]